MPGGVRVVSVASLVEEHRRRFDGSSGSESPDARSRIGIRPPGTENSSFDQLLSDRRSSTGWSNEATVSRRSVIMRGGLCGFLRDVGLFRQATRLSRLVAGNGGGLDGP
jgi:hypothetical protein